MLPNIVDEKKLIWKLFIDKNWQPIHLFLQLQLEPTTQGWSVWSWLLFCFTGERQSDRDFQEQQGQAVDGATLKELTQKYSQFINIPIYLWGNKTETVEEST